MIKLFRYLKLKEWLYFLISLVFIVAQVFLDLKLPDYMSRITMLVETSGSAMGDIWSAGGMMLLSGFYQGDDADIVSRAAAEQRFDTVGMSVDNNWCCLKLIKN